MASFSGQPAGEPSPSPLPYGIHKCSSFSSSYHPSNILKDIPADQGSRWSSSSSDPPQYLILKLQRTSIVEYISFGKYEKTHVCNLKKFKVYGGLTEESMIELLESGLKNDEKKERFQLKHEIDGYVFPCRYLKIIPLQSWGPSFNYSIWFIELLGSDSPEIINPALERFSSYREKEAIRVCLKHLRDHNYLEAVSSLQKKTKIQLEDPLLTELNTILVRKGDFDEAEHFIEHATLELDLFQEYISAQDYKPVWNQIITIPLKSDGLDEPERPGPRGGHQLICSEDSIFLFGGWNGHEDLSDFWKFDLATQRWNLISPNTELDGGPGPRSCHKMICHKNKIYILGRYLDSGRQRQLKSDFYAYDIVNNKWTLLFTDTSNAGGPQLIFDHQMAVDPKEEMIYVFGGRILGFSSVHDNNLDDVPGDVVGGDEVELPPSPPFLPGEVGPGIIEEAEQRQQMLDAARNLVNLAENQFVIGVGDGIEERVVGANANVNAGVEGAGGLSPGLSPLNSANSELSFSGLYSYSIKRNEWTLIRNDIGSTKLSKNNIRSRVGHSMLFHSKTRKLYIFAGQRSKEYLNDFFSYDVDHDTIEIISDGNKKLPSPGFTQRATIDPDLNEIYIFSGLSKDKDKRDEHVQNSFWVFNIERKTWSCVLRNIDSTVIGESSYWNTSQDEPCPRFAHSLVFEPKSKTHYLFGGNPGKGKDPKFRLDDFWKLRLIRPSKTDILQQCKLLLRTMKYTELAESEPIEALLYLQNFLFEIIDHSDANQTKEFQRLTLLLFPEEEENMNDEYGDQVDQDEMVLNRSNAIVLKRSYLFDRIIRYFPDHMTQPKINLIDLLPL